jgi:hypothetical protein
VDAAELVRQIQQSGVLLSLAITGGGAEAIGELLRHGGGSKTLLSAVVPYHPEAFRRYVGGVPDYFCSPEAARALAMAAFHEARALAGPDARVIGVGATCALAKDDERPDRSHRIYVAVQGEAATVTRSLDLEPGRTRQQEEALAAAMILDAIAEGCGVAARPTVPLGERERVGHAQAAAVGSIHRVMTGREDRVALVLAGEPRDRPALVFPGSFNPLHEGHVHMAEVAHELTGAPVDFEISVVNVDKPRLDYAGFADRLAAFERQRRGCFGQLWLTRAPSFFEKARLFPGARFVVGFDTLVRIGDPGYYDSSEAMERRIRALRDEFGIRFLAFHRGKADGRISTDDDLRGLPPLLLEMVEVVPRDRVEAIAFVSSSARRKQGMGAP